MNAKRKSKSFKISKEEYDYGYIGDFGVIMRNRSYPRIEWIACRDELSEIMGLGRLLFYCEKNCVQDTKAFIRKIESIVGIPRKNRVKFRRTNKQNIIYVSLGDFWKTIVHRSLLTILLRAGRYYHRKQDNWRSVIENDDYLRNTKCAIKRFLDGYTRPTLNYSCFGSYDCFSGWVDEFRYDDKETIKSKLRQHA